MISKMCKITLLGHADSARGEMRLLSKGILEMCDNRSGKELMELLNEN